MFASLLSISAQKPNGPKGRVSCLFCCFQSPNNTSELPQVCQNNDPPPSLSLIQEIFLKENILRILLKQDTALLSNVRVCASVSQA